MTATAPPPPPPTNRQTGPAALPAGPTTSATTSIVALYRVLLRGVITRGRVISLVALGALGVLLGFVARSGADTVQGKLDPTNGVQLVAEFGLTLLLPLAAVLTATPVLGSIIEDRLLVYLWLKPIPRWHLAAAAVAAAATVLLPAVVIPLVLMAAISGSQVVAASVIAGVLGVLAYSGLFVALGVRFTWGLWFGLLYILLWENTVARFSDGTARLAIRSYLATILERANPTGLALADRAGWATYLIPLAIAVAGTAYAGFRLSRRDIE